MRRLVVVYKNSSLEILLPSSIKGMGIHLIQADNNRQFTGSDDFESNSLCPQLFKSRSFEKARSQILWGRFFIRDFGWAQNQDTKKYIYLGSTTSFELVFFALASSVLSNVKNFSSDYKHHSWKMHLEGSENETLRLFQENYFSFKLRNSKSFREPPCLNRTSQK